MAANCIVDECQRPAYGRREHCEMHYRRVLKSGDPGPPGLLQVRGVCVVDDCHEFPMNRSIIATTIASTIDWRTSNPGRIPIPAVPESKISSSSR